MGPLATSPPKIASFPASPVPEPPPLLRVDFPTLHFPDIFQQRVRALPTSTTLHVPQSCRLRKIAIVAGCWNGLAAGVRLGGGTPLQTAAGLGTRRHSASRRSLQARRGSWEQSEFEALLQRLKQLKLVNQKSTGSASASLSATTQLAEVTTRDALQQRAPTGRPRLAWCLP